MKIFIVLVATFACSLASGQTNTITFVNHYGDVISNAVAFKIAPNKLLYRDSAGGGTVNLSDLPTNIQAEFGYDAAKAAADEKLEKQKQAIEQRPQWQQAVEEGVIDRMNADLAYNAQVRLQVVEFDEFKFDLISEEKLIEGNVIQKNTNGELLVDCPKVSNDDTSNDFHYNGRCLLVDYPKVADYPKPSYDQLTNGSVIIIRAYPDDEGTYIDSENKMEIAKKFSCDLNRILRERWQEKMRQGKKDQSSGIDLPDK